MSLNQNPMGARSTLETGTGPATLYRLNALEEQGLGRVSRLPFSIKVLLESMLRHLNGREIKETDIESLLNWDARQPAAHELPFKPARVLLQDFTGVPALVDLAAMRSAMERMGGDPKQIEPSIPSELVIDHSVQVDSFANPDALKLNMQFEFRRNRERYEFLKWGQNAFDSFHVIPPGVGIVHQVNLEYFARGVFDSMRDGERVLYPDSLVGTDSHTTMINGLGIVGWGVGGIEAEAVMLGQPLYMLTPRVIGFRLSGELSTGATATDLTLTVTQMLREKGVVGAFVEFFGPGLSSISLPDRATIANMSPEYGATMGFFPVDKESLNYMRRTGRSEDHILTMEAYLKEQGLFRTDDTPEPEFTDRMELDLSTVQPSLAGPKRPQDRIPLSRVKRSFAESLQAPFEQRGFQLGSEQLDTSVPIEGEDYDGTAITHGSVVIAAITSCTNTSNPSVMLGAGILAKKAVERGLSVPPYVKTSLAPGSRVVTHYYRESGLDTYLEALGFHTVGYGCTTCIGNSGPLPEPVQTAIETGDLVVASVLSGNRNFEGRVNPLTKANYLASPVLVVAYALAGSMNVDLATEPLGTDRDGHPVMLDEIWPTPEDIAELMDNAANPDIFKSLYRDVNSFNPEWNKIEAVSGDSYNWQPDSTYIQEPPFFQGMSDTPEPIQSIEGARVLALLGDSVTTDHISPAGAIPEESPAGRYLIENGVPPKHFNSYGSRRGNDNVMVRGTFANIRLKNLLAPGTEGGVTRYQPDGEEMWIYDAAVTYQEQGVPLVVLAGKEYGTGSSRDWAAKGTRLLGVRAVIAESYERIHRSNLVGMGVLPLQFQEGDSAARLGLDGTESYDIRIDDSLKAGQTVDVVARNKNGKEIRFKVLCRIDTPVEIRYYQHGGILQAVLRDMLST